jgi:hypothetical protein
MKSATAYAHAAPVSGSGSGSGNGVGKNVWHRRDAITSQSSSSDLAGPIVGIDFGTSNSCIAVWHPVQKRAKVIRRSAESQQYVTPSTVQFHGIDFTSYKVGVTGIDLRVPIVSGVKSQLGTLDTIRCLNAAGDHADMSASDICAMILRELIHNAETYLRKNKLCILPESSPEYEKLVKAYAYHNITSAVIGIPAHFSETRKSALKKAANEAGLHNVSAVNIYCLGHLINVCGVPCDAGTFHDRVIRSRDELRTVCSRQEDCASV